LYTIACCNAANLILVRSLLRRRELGVRMALGCSRGRIVRLLLVETLMLAALGGVAGLLIAKWCWSVFGPLLPPTVFIFSNVLQLDKSALIVAASLTTVTCVLVALVPAWRVTQSAVNDTLKEGGGWLGDTRRLGRLRNALTVVQTAFAVILLLAACLMMQTFRRLVLAGVGFEPSNRLIISASLPTKTSLETYQQCAASFTENIRQLPGPKEIAMGSGDPIQIGGMAKLTIVGRSSLGPILCNIGTASPNYFSTWGIPFLAGHGFTGMKPGDPPVTVINETFARRCFAGESPLGKYLEDGDGKAAEIIGVAGDVCAWTPQNAILPRCYYPTWQTADFSESLTLAIHWEGATISNLESVIRRAAYNAHPDLVVGSITKAEDLVRDRTLFEKDSMLLLQAISMLSLLLAAVGLFAVMAYAVAQRKREYGVRMALGASPENLQWFVLRNGMKVTLVGISIGLCAAWGLTRLLQSILFETSPHDPFAYVGSAVALFGVAALACWLPARRAANVDPVEALRAE